MIMKQIQWFPGHMAKTRREIREHVKFVDVVLELVDARIPYSSQNPDIDEMIGNTPKIILFNKADLADRNELAKWRQYYAEKGVSTLDINAAAGQGLNKILPLMKAVLGDQIAKEIRQGRTPRPLRAMILGIPNVGTSTLINSLASKKKRNTADRPGVTRETQYIRVGSDFELLDTPGILWPRFEDEGTARKLALTGAIKDSILPKDEVVIAGFRLLNHYYPGRLEERYDIQVDIDDVVAIYDAIGRRRGCLLPGNEIDYERVSDIFLHDFRHEQFGKLMLDRVDEIADV